MQGFIASKCFVIESYIICNADWNRQSKILKQQFDRTLERCNIYEILVFLETMDMEISGELAINKQRALKPKCK